MAIQQSTRKYNLIQFFTILGIIVLVNISASYIFKRFDLTAEKRYTLSSATKEMMEELDDVVFVKVYLEGEFPAGFKRLRNETKEMLDEFRAYAGDNIQYEFINPSASSDMKERNEFYQQLAMKGLQPTNLDERKEDGSNAQQIIFPGALISYKGREIPLQLLKSQIGTSPEVMLNNSIKDLEYEFANTLRKLKQGPAKPKVAFIEGHRELSEMQVADISNALKEYYTVERKKINEQLTAIKDYRAIIIAKPDSAFSEKDKFIIDQFIMNGGKVLWLIDPVFASMDSLTTYSETVGLGRPLNLDDMLFKYGVRINTNLIMDIQCTPIPLVTGYVGNQPQTRLYPWYFFPLVFQSVKHPIVNNLNAIKLEFASTLDTVGNYKIRKQVLLTTSQYSKTVNTPARISLGIVKKEPEQQEYNKSFLPVGVLLEGQFESVFKNQVTPEIENSKEIGFKTESKATRMIVIGDGDIVKNDIQKSSGKVYPLGYDKYTRETYGNKNFILNAMNYLCDDSGLLEIRNREVKLRLLDKTKLQKEKTKWQAINVATPVVLVILMGIVLFYLRKKKYGYN